MPNYNNYQRYKIEISHRHQTIPDVNKNDIIMITKITNDDALIKMIFD